MSIFIPGDVMSSKNAKRIIPNRGKTGQRFFILDSIQVVNYKKATRHHWESNRNIFKKMSEYKKLPLKVEFQFVRETKRRFDFVNMLQLPLDCMVAHQWIEDDDYLNIVPVINPEVIFDKRNPGLFIKIIQ